MANVQKISGKRGTSYRVQFMRNGRRVGQTFPRKKDAEAFLAQITVSDDLADALTNVTLSTTTLSQAIRDYLDQYNGRDPSIIQRLIPIGLNIRSVLSNLGYKVTSPAPHRQ